MFTGIIEDTGIVTNLKKSQDNLQISITSSITQQLKIDQSISHNGVCFTVVDILNNTYTVTAIKETLEKSNLNELKEGDLINLERAMIFGNRLDGHLVQGHVDCIGICRSIDMQNGSWLFSFTYKNNEITVEKGSITVNGVSLTVVNSKANQFSVAIIPYTFEHTNFKQIKVGDTVNLEFDIIGKYIKRLYDQHNSYF